MTKIHSKALISGMLLASFILPTFAAAQTTTTERERRPIGGTGETRENFCTKIDVIAARVTTAMTERETRHSTNRSNRKVKLDERFQTRDTTRVDNRDDWDQKRNEWKTKLTEKAANDPAKVAAVNKFIAAVDAAVLKRRTAVDTAVAAYRTAVDAEIKARQGAVDAAVAQFKTDTAAAMTKAKADCTANITPKTVREAYVAAMKAAREKLKLAIKTLDKRNEAFKPLAETRKKAVETAVAEFKATMKTATYDLKQSIKV